MWTRHDSGPVIIIMDAMTGGGVGTAGGGYPPPPHAVSPLSPPHLQHIDKVFKHKELQQQLMDAKLQRITELTREVEEKQRREREFVSPKLCRSNRAISVKRTEF